MDDASYGSTRDSFSGSQLLQERLMERRARNTRPKRSRQTDVGPRLPGRDDDIFLTEARESRHAHRPYDSSPLTAGPRVASSAARSSAHNLRRSMGVRDVDEQLDRLSKQNFDLKLELDHRREHTIKLQEQLEAMREQVERAQKLEEEHAELLRINTQMVEELEKRDKAVQEAVDYICELEDKLAELEERPGHTRPSTANADSGYAGTETHDPVPPSSPPEIRTASDSTITAPRLPPTNAAAASRKLHTAVNTQTPARVRREPSFLSHKKPSTHALRSVYLEQAGNLHSVQSFNSLLSKRDSRAEDPAADDVLNSPRLSVLSESSFPSLYSPKKIVSPEKYAWEEDDDDDMQHRASHPRQDSIKRVSRWMEGRNGSDDTPSKGSRVTSPLAQEMSRSETPRASEPRESLFRSMEDALSAAPTVVRHDSDDQHPSRSSTKARRTGQNPGVAAPVGMSGALFGEPLLPPTPESVSTRMLRGSRSTITTERSLLDVTPAPVKSFQPLEPGLRTAPKQMRSSVELNGAFHNYHEYHQRQSGLRHERGESSSSGGDDEDDDMDADARSATVKDLSLDYDGFPDGNSILMGTPSRFLKHGPPRPGDVQSDGYSLLDPPLFPPHRRPSSSNATLKSSDATLSPRRYSFSRADSSPTLFGTLTRMMSTAGGNKPSQDNFAPVGFGRANSQPDVAEQEGGHPILPPPEPTRSRSQTSRTSPSPARSLSQRTQKFFRRLSNSHAEGTRSEREKSPMPQLLTRTMSADQGRMEPSQQSNRLSMGGAQKMTHRGAQDAPAGHGRRPSLQARTQTEPISATRPPVRGPVDGNATPTGPAGTTSRPLGRSQSTRNPHVAPVPITHPPTVGGGSGMPESNGSVSSAAPAKPGTARRRGSIREPANGPAASVVARRPWR